MLNAQHIPQNLARIPRNQRRPIQAIRAGRERQLATSLDVWDQPRQPVIRNLRRRHSGWHVSSNLLLKLPPRQDYPRSSQC